MPAKIPYFRPRHLAPAARDYEALEDRLTAKRFYASARWVRLAARYKRHHPLCEPCLEKGETTPVRQVHHRQDRRSHPELAFDWENLESVCIPCHNGKRAS